MKTSLLIIIFLVLIGCAKREAPTETKITFSNLSSKGIVNAGGVMLYGSNGIDNFSVTAPATSNEITLNLKKGDWIFYAYGWEGPGIMKGTLRCGKQAARIDGPDVLVNLTINNGNCAQAAYNTPSALAGANLIGQPKGLILYGCSLLHGVDPNFTYPPKTDCTYPEDMLGFSESIKIQLEGFNTSTAQALPGLLTACIPRGPTGTFITDIPMPFRGTLKLFRTRILGYKNNSCATSYVQDGVTYTEQPNVLYFPNGISLTSDKTNIITRTDTMNHVYFADNELGIGYTPLWDIMPMIDCNGSPCIPPSPATESPGYSQQGATARQIIAETVGGITKDQIYRPSETAKGELWGPSDTWSIEANSVSYPGANGNGITISITYNSGLATGVTIDNSGPQPHIIYNWNGITPDNATSPATLKAYDVYTAIDIHTPSSNIQTHSIPYSGGMTVLASSTDPEGLIDRVILSGGRNYGPDSNMDDDNHSALGEIRKMMGGDGVGIFLWKHGITSCSQISNATPAFDLIDTKEDAVYKVSFRSAPYTRQIQPTAMGGNGSKFEKGILLKKNGIPEFAIEFNCTNKRGWLRANDSWDYNGIVETAKMEVFYDATDPLSARLEYYAMSDRNSGEESNKLYSLFMKNSTDVEFMAYMVSLNSSVQGESADRMSIKGYVAPLPAASPVNVYTFHTCSMETFETYWGQMGPNVFDNDYAGFALDTSGGDATLSPIIINTVTDALVSGPSLAPDLVVTYPSLPLIDPLNSNPQATSFLWVNNDMELKLFNLNNY